MKKLLATILFTSALVSGLYAQQHPIWLEQDSVQAIEYRIQQDFSISYGDGIEKLIKMYPNVNFNNVRAYVDNHYLETKIINGVEMMHRKSIGNFKLLCPQVRGNWEGRGGSPDKEDIEMVESILGSSLGNGSIVCGKRIKFKFTIEVPKHNFLKGDTVKVWMPVPIESARQRNIKVISTSQSNYALSANSKSEHNTMYMSQIVDDCIGDTLRFYYIGEYDTYGQYFSEEYILNNIKPYNSNSELYKKYTSTDHKHIINLEPLARSIVGSEKSPYKQSELIYEFISQTYPWAGAREYSTIESLPKYVLDEKHGDCGQVSLLYISLMRSLGVPARWESGWMLHPWSKNLHDWAEVYFEGVGWVPVDVSFGRYVNSINLNVRNFFSKGMDCYRFASNTGICSPLYPTKTFIRSETIDFQLGEVECSKGNLFYPGWKKRLDVISIQDI